MTYTELTARLASYLDAEQKILQSQHYQVGDGQTARMNRRADLEPVQAQIKALSDEIARHPQNPANRNLRRVRTLRPLN
jgi:paraquat-inducible protein B